MCTPTHTHAPHSALIHPPPPRSLAPIFLLTPAMGPLKKIKKHFAFEKTIKLNGVFWNGFCRALMPLRYIKRKNFCNLYFHKLIGWISIWRWPPPRYYYLGLKMPDRPIHEGLIVRTIVGSLFWGETTSI